MGGNFGNKIITKSGNVDWTIAKKFIKGLKTDLGSQFDSAGRSAKEEIDLVVEKFDDLRKFVDSEGVQQHMQATRVAAAKLVKSLVGSVASLKEASEDAAEKTDWASKFEREAAKMKSSKRDGARSGESGKRLSKRMKKTRRRRTTMMKATNLMTMTMMKRTRRNTRRSKTRNTKMTMTTMTKKTRRRNTKRNRRERRRRMMTMTTKTTMVTNHLMTNMIERNTRRRKGANTRKGTMTMTITGVDMSSQF